MIPLTSSEIHDIAKATARAAVEESRAETKDVAEEAAKKALVEMFLTLGVDVSNPTGVLRLQRNLKYVDGLAGSAEIVTKNGLKALVMFVVPAALGYLIWLFNSK